MPALALLAAFACMGWMAPAQAVQDDSQATARLQAFLDSLHPQTGTVSIATAKASLRLTPGYAFLPAQEAQRVLSGLWNNPPDKSVLGMILPSANPRVLLDASSWAVVVTYTDEGHVSDADAEKIDYTDMLRRMQKGNEESNPERIKHGYPAIELLGWAEPPHYDANSHKLYWARDLKFSKADGSTQGRSLNYDIRVLGRSGYLSLNAVSSIDRLARVETDMPQVLAMTEFDPGERYDDFDSKTDKLAAYGIGALVAGGIAAKAGLFAKLGLMLLALKKFVILGIAAIGAAFRKFFKRDKGR
jgi:uncharacterized membrane-anchored protein